MKFLDRFLRTRESAVSNDAQDGPYIVPVTLESGNAEQMYRAWLAGPFRDKEFKEQIPERKEETIMAKGQVVKFTVAEAIAALQQFPDDAEARGFSKVKVHTKPVELGKVNKVIGD